MAHGTALPVLLLQGSTVSASALDAVALTLPACRGLRCLSVAGALAPGCPCLLLVLLSPADNSLGSRQVSLLCAVLPQCQQLCMLDLECRHGRGNGEQQGFGGLFSQATRWRTTAPNT